MKRILIIGPAWIGDMVMAQSLFKKLKAQPEVPELHVAAPAWTLPLLARMKEVSGVTALPFQHGRLDLRARFRIAQVLRQQGFDQAFVLPNSFKSALIPWFAGIPQRTGYAREGRSLLLNDVRMLDEKKWPLMVERYLALGENVQEAATLDPALFYPELVSTPEDQDAALKQLGLSPQKGPILALCPGAEFGPSKRWPEDYYATLAQQKLSEGFQVWLFGSVKDKPVTEKIKALAGEACVDLAGRTTLAEALDLLALAALVVSNDSGLMHVAAALKRPLLVLYGSSSPAFTPPLSKQVALYQLNLPCQPCFQRVCPLKHHACLRDLKPAALLPQMAEWMPS